MKEAKQQGKKTTNPRKKKKNKNSTFLRKKSIFHLPLERGAVGQ